MLKTYFPYKSDKPDKKFFIITSQGKKVYFGAAGMSDYTIHKDPLRRDRYIQRHQKREGHLWNKAGIDSPSFWSRFLLWNLPSFELSYKYIKKNFL